MLKTFLKKTYTYFFIISIFVTFGFQTYILLDKTQFYDPPALIIRLLLFLMVYAPFVISLSTSHIIEKKRNEKNHKKLSKYEFIINLILSIFTIFILYFSFFFWVVVTADWPTPS